MGLIDDTTFRSFDTYPFDETSAIELQGEPFELENWERRVVETRFPKRCSVLVVAAGGLRELVALNRMGYVTEGIEYGSRLWGVARDWLAQNQPEQPFKLADRYKIPDKASNFDAAFVARHYYSHIPDRSQRVDFLRAIRGQLKTDATLLLSYYRFDHGWSFEIQAAIANVLRRLRGKGNLRVEVGDHLDPESALYHHHFADGDVVSELQEAGFEPELQDSSWFGWAVARPVQLANQGSSAVSESEGQQSDLDTDVVLAK